jgi:hypothetical protein
MATVSCIWRHLLSSALNELMSFVKLTSPSTGPSDNVVYPRELIFPVSSATWVHGDSELWGHLPSLIIL